MSQCTAYVSADVTMQLPQIVHQLHPVISLQPATTAPSVSTNTTGWLSAAQLAQLVGYQHVASNAGLTVRVQPVQCRLHWNEHYHGKLPATRITQRHELASAMRAPSACTLHSSGKNCIGLLLPATNRQTFTIKKGQRAAQ